VINSLGERSNTAYPTYNRNYSGTSTSSSLIQYNMITVVPTTLIQQYVDADNKTYEKKYQSMAVGLLPIIGAFKMVFSNLTVQEIAQIFVDTADKTILLKNGTNYTLIFEDQSKLINYNVPIGTKTEKFDPYLYGAGFLDLNEAFERAKNLSKQKR
jgi:hypothetical protein